jgi:hypothetical protein
MLFQTIVLGAVIAGFAAFAFVLAWADYVTTHR